MTLQHLNYPDHSNGHLTGEHGQLLSIAVVQRQLASSLSELPDQREGKITVAFNSTDKNWRLSVLHNGVGKPAVHADATHLEADVQVSSASPKTVVSFVHDHLAVAPIGRAA